VGLGSRVSEDPAIFIVYIQPRGFHDVALSVAKHIPSSVAEGSATRYDQGVMTEGGGCKSVGVK